MRIFAIGQFSLVWLVRQKMVVGISYSFPTIIGPLIAIISNFIQIEQKTRKLEIYAVGRFWLVGLAGQKMAVATYNSIYVVSEPLLAPIPNFIQIG